MNRSSLSRTAAVFLTIFLFGLTPFVSLKAAMPKPEASSSVMPPAPPLMGPDLSIKLFADPSPVPPGGVLTYWAIVGYAYSGVKPEPPASNVTVTIPIPDGTNYTHSDVNGSSDKCTWASDMTTHKESVKCELGSMIFGSTMLVTVKVNAPTSATEINGSASVDSDFKDKDINASNNTSDVTTKVVDASATPEASPPPATPGDTTAASGTPPAPAPPSAVTPPATAGSKGDGGCSLLPMK